MNIPFADLTEFLPLPIDATDPFDTVRVVIAPNLVGTISPQDIAVKRGTSEFHEYVPGTIERVYVAQTPQLYERSVQYRGKNPFLPVSVVPGYWNTLLTLGTTGAANAYDEDPDTGASNTGTGPMQFGFSFDEGFYDRRVCGFAIAYQLLDRVYTNSGGQATRFPVTATISYATATYMTAGFYALPPTEGILPTSTPGVVVTPPTQDQRVSIFYAALPPDAFMYADNGGPGTWATQITVEAYSFTAAQDFYIVEFYPLIVDVDRMASFAKPFSRLPTTRPLKITVPYIVIPAAQHTITGYPGGDYTAIAARHEHIDGSTSIYFEEPGTNEEVKGERAVRGVIERELARAGYDVMMAVRR